MDEKTTISTKIIADLNVKNLLGDGVPYVHNNDTIRFQGSKIVREHFDAGYNTLMNQIESVITDWINRLRTREQEWYANLSNESLQIDNFQDFEDKIWPLLLNSKVAGKGNRTINEGLADLTSIVTLNWEIRSEVKNNSSMLASNIQKTSTLVTEIDKLAATYMDDPEAFTRPSPGKKGNEYVNSVAQMKAIKEDSTLTAKKMVGYVSQNMGWVAEGIWSKGAVDQYNELVSEKLKNIKVTHVGKDFDTVKTGKINQKHLKGTGGATDIVFAFDTFTVGATIKTRYQAGNYISPIPVFGSGVEQTFNQAFAENQNTHKIAYLDKNALDALKYLLINYWFSNRQTKRIKDQQKFINQVRNMLAYNYSLYAVLGTNWSSVTQGVDLLPLIYISGNKVYPTRAILELILISLKNSKNGSTSPQNIASSKYYGPWQDPASMGIRPDKKKKQKKTSRKKHTAINRPVDLYSAKEEALKRLDSVTYAGLRGDPNVQKFLEDLNQEFFNKGKKIYRVSYEIKNSNIAAQAKKGA